MSYREFIEWLAFIQLEQGQGRQPQSRDGGWSQFKAGMLAIVNQQQGAQLVKRRG